MAKSSDQIVAEIDRKQNEEDKDLLPRAGRAIAGAAKKVYNAATGKDAKDFEPRLTSEGDLDFIDTSAVRSPVSGTGQDVRSLNMGAKSKTPKPSDMMKKGGTVKSSASKRADGCCIRGKTRA
jgi:hypothetical protein